jgi:hypothetical protein
MRIGLSEVLRSCAMERDSRAWKRGGTGRGNWTVQLLYLVLIRQADVIAKEY